MKSVLWYIPVSHFSEKARWALAWKDVQHRRRTPPPGSHVAVALWLTRGRSATFPIMQMDGRTIPDSTAIIGALEACRPQPALYPEDPGERRRALDLEEFFDEELGPPIRQLLWHEMGKEPARFSAMAANALPATARRVPGIDRAVSAYGRAFTSVRYGAANAQSAERSGARVLAALDRLEAELDGREYLVGDSFSVADLTAAALFYPLVLPEGGPRVLIELPTGFREFRAPLRERRGCRWVEEMFRRHRKQRRSS
jgi:glutathione S-transferase